MKYQVNVVVGSWGSYNACNERALRSSWICFNDYSSWEEIQEVLTSQGFELNGLDEELFIQDIEGLELDNCDKIHPARLFEILDESEFFLTDDIAKLSLAYIEVKGFFDFIFQVETYGPKWHEDLNLYEDIDNFTDLAYNKLVEDFGYLNKVDDFIARYFDYEQFGRNLSFDNYYLTSYGILEVR